MAKKRKEQARVLAQKQLASGIYDCLLETTLAKEAKPGQFIALYPKDKSTLLPRPISICEADAERNTLRIVYRVVGAGTEEFSQLKEGDTVDILGVLGNGFPLDQLPAGSGERRSDGLPDGRRHRRSSHSGAGKALKLQKADHRGIPGCGLFPAGGL